MNQVKDLLAKLFLLGIAFFIFTGSGFQPIPDRCEGTRGSLKVFISNGGQTLNFSPAENYLEDTNLHLRVSLDVVPISAPFPIISLLKGIDFDNDRYSVSKSDHRDMVSEDLFPSVRDAVASFFQALSIANSMGYGASDCQFHQITFEEQQVILDIHIGDQVLPDFDFFPLILKAFEEEAPNHGFEVVN